MLKLFHSPGACSLVSHVALEEARADFEPIRVRRKPAALRPAPRVLGREGLEPI